MFNAQTGRLAATMTVCLVAFYVSFSDIVAVALHYGQPARVAYAYPIGIDALVLVCALTLVASRGVSRTTRFYAKLGRWYGFGATIYCNAIGAQSSDAHAVAVHTIPAVSLILAVELVIHASKGTARVRPGRRS